MSRFNSYLKASAIAAAVVMSLSSAPRRPYSPREKAFFTDAATIDFVRPGLTITVKSAAIASDGTITVSYMLADPSGLPLDSADASNTTTLGEACTVCHASGAAYAVDKVHAQY